VLVAKLDAHVLPRSVASSDQSRMDDYAVWTVQNFFDGRRPVADICHRPWAIVEADRPKTTHVDILAEPAN